MNRCGHLGLAAIAWFAFVLCTPAQSATELASGLVYLRPTAQLESIRLPAETPAVVIDLRQVAPADTDAVNALLTAVKPGSASPHRLILALVTPHTAPALRSRLAHLPRCLTIGRSSPDFRADIVVAATAEADRHALAALAEGTSPEKLISEHLNKPRYDESALVREHNGEPEGTAKKAPVEPTSDKVTPLEPSSEATDAVLLRAVHIYLGLVALKKI